MKKRVQLLITFRATFRLRESDQFWLIGIFWKRKCVGHFGSVKAKKISGTNGVNFGFVKEFWEDIKDGFIRVMAEFHANGRMVKRANFSFINCKLMTSSI